MKASRKETLTKVCIGAVMVAMVGFSVANVNPEGIASPSDCNPNGQVVIIPDGQTPLASAPSTTSSKVTVHKSKKVQKLKKASAKSSTKTQKKVKNSSSTKVQSGTEVKTKITVATTTKTILKKKSKNKTIQTTVKTTTKTTKTVKSGAVPVRTLASKADKRVLNAFEGGSYKVVVNPKVSYAGVFRSATKSIELRNANTVVYHELGHFLAYKAGRAEYTGEFQDIYKSEKSKYTASNKAYVLQSASEYFGESFKNYTENPSKLKAERPKTYAYIVKTLDKLG